MVQILLYHGWYKLRFVKWINIIINHIRHHDFFVKCNFDKLTQWRNFLKNPKKIITPLLSKIMGIFKIQWFFPYFGNGIRALRIAHFNSSQVQIRKNFVYINQQINTFLSIGEIKYANIIISDFFFK